MYDAEKKKESRNICVHKHSQERKHYAFMAK